MVCVDEKHLIDEDGHNFRTNFQSLKSNFSKLKKGDNKTMILVFHMMATFDIECKVLLEKMNGLISRNENDFWDEIDKLPKRHMEIAFYCVLQPLSTMKAQFLKCSNLHFNHEAIIATSTGKRGNELQPSLDL